MDSLPDLQDTPELPAERMAVILGEIVVLCLEVLIDYCAWSRVLTQWVIPPHIPHARPSSAPHGRPRLVLR